MPFFRIQLFKEHPESNRPFSNTYIVSATDMFAAQGAADIIKDFEQDMYDNAFLITYARVSTVAEDGNVYTTIPYNVNGNSAPSGTGLPLFNTLRVDITTTGFGRPTHMHYRNLSEGVIVGSAIDGTFLSAHTALVNGLIADLNTNDTPWVQEDGDHLVNATSFPKVVQRSLHRKRRKPVTP